MKKLLFLLIIFFPFTVFAHVPEIVKEVEYTEIKEPEISKAFYGELNGEPENFIIESSEPFLLYLGLLTPDLSGNNSDFNASVKNDADEELLKLNGDDVVWEEYYEEFAGDTYLEGPEAEKNVESGKYFIEVSSPDNEGKYVLATGKIERFNSDDIAQTTGVLPELKTDYFEKSYFSVFQGVIGYSVLGLGLFVLFIVIVIIVLIIRRRKKK